MYNEFLKALNQVQGDRFNKNFCPLTESDVVARTYYHLVNNNIELLNKIFLENESVKGIYKIPDLVVGAPIKQENKRHIVEPKLIAEFTFIGSGSKDKGNDRRLTKVRGEINALGRVEIPCFICIYDTFDWLRHSPRGLESRINTIVDHKNRVNSRLYIVIFLTNELVLL